MLRRRFRAAPCFLRAFAGQAQTPSTQTYHRMRRRGGAFVFHPRECSSIRPTPSPTSRPSSDQPARFSTSSFGPRDYHRREGVLHVNQLLPNGWRAPSKAWSRSATSSTLGPMFAKREYEPSPTATIPKPGSRWQRASRRRRCLGGARRGQGCLCGEPERTDFLVVEPV